MEGAEPHTCQMICHYRGVSSQLSPSNHPSYPSSRAQTLSSPPKTPSAFLGGLGFHSRRCYPICPSFLYTRPREKMYPPRSCSPPPYPYKTETVSILCVGRACMAFVCIHKKKKKKSVFTQEGQVLFVPTPGANPEFEQRRQQ